MRFLSRFTKTAAYVLVVIALLTACSARASTEKPVMRIGYLPITHAALPLIVYAQTQGQMDTFQLEMIRFSSWPEMAEAIQAGQIDGGGSILSSLALKIASNGVPFQSVLMTVRDGNVMVVSQQIDSVDDLRGKTIAIPSRFSSHYVALHQYLTEHGIDPVTEVQTPEMAPSDMLQALASGSVDGFIVAEPFGSLAETLQIGKILFLSKDYDAPGFREDECIVGIRSEFIERHPEAVQEFVERLIQVGIWAEENPREAAELLQPYLGQQADVIARSFIEPSGRTSFIDLYPRHEEYVAFQDYLLKLNLIDRPVDIDRFVEERFAEQAYQKLGLKKPE